MNRLESDFGEQIEFVLLDWDDRTLNDIRAQYDITGRTQYVLVSPDDEIVRRWFGPLSYDAVADALQAYLDEN